MNKTDKPSKKPANPNFSSGPCSKRPGWTTDALKGAFLGRSHRHKDGAARIRAVIEKQRELLGIPADYKVGVVPGSDTGAIEMALWGMLGARGVDVLVWEQFGQEWQTDITKELKIADARTFKAGYGELPDLSQVDSDRDIVFTWNGTTSGVRVPNGDWIKADREGLTFCDATSAVFAYDMPWDKLDVTTWSWQKALGGEAAHGMIVLSPRAVERLTQYTPDRPLPKLFRLMKKGEVLNEVFEGLTINTPSMLCVEDCHDALRWVESVGGLKGTMKRTQANFAAIEKWVAQTSWIEFLAPVPETRAMTSVCLKITDPWVAALPEDEQQAFIKAMTKKLESEGVAYDCASYRSAPPGLRFWVGATVETGDVEAVLPWVEWAFDAAKSETQKKAA
jgi:phosphoserine aminotransferase